MRTFQQFLKEHAIQTTAPFSPTGQGARKFYVNRLPPDEVQHLQAADASLQQGDPRGAMENLQRAMEVYTSQGVQGDQNPNYRMLRVLFDNMYHRWDQDMIPSYRQGIQTALKQITQPAGQQDQ